MLSVGLEQLLKDPHTLQKLSGLRVGLLAHPASVNKELRHAIDLISTSPLNLSCAFGPQHGLKGEKQDNMIESEDDHDPQYKYSHLQSLRKSPAPHSTNDG